MKAKETSPTYTTKKGKYTYQDYLKLPEDGKRHEILNGELIMTPAPTPLHQLTSGAIYKLLSNYVEQHHLGYVLYAPCDVVLDEFHVVQPDILYISKANKKIISDNNINGVPDLIIEIISPTTAYYDLVEKKDIYQRFGVREYWLVDPKRRSIQIFVLKKSKFIQDQELIKSGKIYSNVLPQLQLSIEQIFPPEET